MSETHERSSSRTKIILSVVGGGGSGIVLLLFLGNWLLAIVVAMLAVFNEEVALTGNYTLVVVLVTACPGMTWKEKKEKLRFVTLIYVEVLHRNAVKRFLGREVV